MKHKWLYTGICAWGICLLPFSFSWVLLLLYLCFLYKRQGWWCIISLGILICIILRLVPQAIIMPEAHMQVQIKEIKTNYMLAQWEKGKVLLYGEAEYGLDDIVEVEVTCDTLAANQNYGQFNFNTYMQKRSVYYGCSMENSTLVEQGSSLRAKLWQRVQSQSEEIGIWLKSTLFHIRSTEEWNHLFYSTGMHISLLLRIVAAFLSLYFIPRKTKGICLVLLMGLLMLDGVHDSMVRIFIFQLVPWLFPRMDSKDQLGISVILLLGYRPYLANELVFVLPFLFRMVSCFQLHKLPRLWLSYLVLIPIQFYYFYEVDPFALFLFPLYRILFMINDVLAFMMILFPIPIWYCLAQPFLSLTSWMDQLSYPFYYQASLSFLLLWFGALFSYVGYGGRRWKKLLLFLCLWTQAEPYLRPYAEVMMLDVGQGDCILIALPFHQGTILIDAPGSETKDIGEEIIVPVLHARGFKELDLVIITHDDLDHSGSLARLQELMPVKQVITKKQADISFHRFRLRFLLQDKTFSDANDNSILTYFEAFGVSFLFMGDAGKKVEAALLQAYPNIQADILKVGHHGSKSASSLPFLHQLHPTLALISCGAHNRYGHPHEEVIASIAQEGIGMLDTPGYGAIWIKITNIFCIYETATHEFGIIKTR